MVSPWNYADYRSKAESAAILVLAESSKSDLERCAEIAPSEACFCDSEPSFAETRTALMTAVEEEPGSVEVSAYWQRERDYRIPPSYDQELKADAVI